MITREHAKSTTFIQFVNAFNLNCMMNWESPWLTQRFEPESLHPIETIFFAVVVQVHTIISKKRLAQQITIMDCALF